MKPRTLLVAGIVIIAVSLLAIVTSVQLSEQQGTAAKPLSLASSPSPAASPWFAHPSPTPDLDQFWEKKALDSSRRLRFYTPTPTPTPKPTVRPAPGVTHRMAIAFVQLLDKQQDTAGTCTLTIPAGGVPIGHRIIVAVGSQGFGPPASISDSKGNAWTADFTGNGTSNGLMIFSAPITNALVASDTITVTDPAYFSGDCLSAIATEWSGIAATSPVDVTASDSSFSAGTSASTGTTAATSETGELAITAFVSSYSSQPPITFLPGTGYTDIGQEGMSNTTSQIDSTYKLLSGTGTQSTTGAYATSFNNYAAAIVTYKPASSGPSISSFSPSSGPVGTALTINGSGFTGATGATVDEVALTSFSVVSDTEITGVIASGTASGLVAVTNGSTVDSSGLTPADFGVTPTVTSYSPSSGPAGTAVTITGSQFTGATAVHFNGVAAPHLVVINDTTITIVVPPGATTGVVSVTNGAGSSNGPSFTVSGGSTSTPTITSFTPTIGPAGTVVTITGTNFLGATDVKFGGFAATSWSIDSATQITATVPTTAWPGQIIVDGFSGEGGSSGSFSLQPTISGFSPSSGADNTLVTITGTGFGDVNQVSFNGVIVPFTHVSGTEITAHYPAVAGSGPIQVKLGVNSATAVSGSSFLCSVTPLADSADFGPNIGIAAIRVTAPNGTSPDRIYSFGGQGQSQSLGSGIVPLSNIGYSVVQADGTLGTFQDAGVGLIYSRFSAQVVRHGNYLYVVGGSTGAEWIPGGGTDLGKTVEVIPINTDGSLGTPVLSSAQLPWPLNNTFVTILGSILLVAGGFSPDGGAGAWAGILECTINSDGTLVGFSNIGTLPVGDLLNCGQIITSTAWYLFGDGQIVRIPYSGTSLGIPSLSSYSSNGLGVPDAQVVGSNIYALANSFSGWNGSTYQSFSAPMTANELAASFSISALGEISEGHGPGIPGGGYVVNTYQSGTYRYWAIGGANIDGSASTTPSELIYTINPPNTPTSFVRTSATGQKNPSFSWSFNPATTGDTQSAFQLTISDATPSVVYDSGKVTSSAQSMTVPLADRLAPGTYTATLKTWGGASTPSSEATL